MEHTEIQWNILPFACGGRDTAQDTVTGVSSQYIVSLL